MKRIYYSMLFSSILVFLSVSTGMALGPYYAICLSGGTNCRYYKAGSPWYMCSTGSNTTKIFYAVPTEDLNCMLNGTYQWYHFVYHPGYCPVGDPDCCHGWCPEPIEGATGRAYTVTEPGEYFCLYNCGSGEVSTDTLEVIYHSDVPYYTSAPDDAEECEGQMAAFSCTYYNARSVTWQEKAPGGDWTSISGESTSTLQVLADAANDLYQYRCIPWNACGSNYEVPPATLDVQLKPYDIADPEPSNPCEDGTANFNTNASGDGISYQWMVSTDDGANYSSLSEQSPYSGTQTKNLVVSPAAGTLHQNRYRCEITGTCGTETTAGAVLNLKFKPDIISDPQAAEICQGDEVSFTVEVEGEEPMEYRWRKDNMVLGNWTSSNTYTIEGASPNDNGKYDVMVKNGCDPDGIVSEKAQLVVNPAPDLSLGVERHICTGESTTIDAGAGYASYNWSTGETSQSIEVSQQGSYTVTVTNNKGCTGKDSLYIVLDPHLPAIDLGTDDSYCPVDAPTLNAGAGFDGYTWSDGSTGQSLKIVESGTYWVAATKVGNVCLSTDTVDIVIIEPYDQERLCIVTIDMRTGKNMLVWEKTPDVHTLSYNLYRESTIDEYEPIGNVPYDNLSVFKDTAVSPENRSWLYKITVVDICGNESDIESVPYHKPIFLSYVPSDEGVDLEWTYYEIEGVGNIGDFLKSFDIYRGTSPADLDWYVTAGSIDHYHDDDAATQTTKFYYRVAGVLKNPCYPSASKKAEEPVLNSMSNLEYNRGVGVEENHMGGSLTIYPNPFTQQTTIRFENPEQDAYRLILVDLSGKTVLMKENIREEKIVLHRNHLKPGFYHVQLTGKKLYRGILVAE